MNKRRGFAGSRTVLAVFCVLGVIAAQDHGRPAWSPDGQQLLCECRVGRRGPSIALYDRRTGKATLQFAPPRSDRFATPLWRPDGKGAVLVWTRVDARNLLSVTRLTIPATDPPKTFEYAVCNGESFPDPPVLVGHHLFLSGDGLTRLDLETGEAKRREPERPGRLIAVAPCGDGVGYLSFARDVEASWELGSVDPDTLQLSPHQKGEKGPRRIRPPPACTRDLARVALATGRDSDGPVAIHVFRNGALETTVPIGRAYDNSCSSLAWSADGTTLHASLCRMEGENRQWSLLETRIGGGAPVETTLRGYRPPEPQVPELSRILMPATSFPLALSPDGQTAAFSNIGGPYDIDDPDDPEAYSGLFLVDLAHVERKVTKLSGPTPAQAVTISVPEPMLELATAWESSRAIVRDVPLLILEPEPGAILDDVLDRAEIAVHCGPAQPSDLAAARWRKIELVGHCIGFEALAVCVHKDNPISSPTVEQLARIFGDPGLADEKRLTRWSELEVQMPAGMDAITAAVPWGKDALSSTFQSMVVGKRRPGASHASIGSSQGLAVFAGAQRNAITCARLADVDDRVKVVPIVGKPGAEPCLPSRATLADGTYPLARSWFVYSRGRSKPEVGAFLVWIKGDEAQKLLAQAGLMPAR
ncbi:MAG TPA: substrate-binding domain-containing protein [Planctomycetota bacterium]